MIDIVERWAAEAPDDLALVSLGAARRDRGRADRGRHRRRVAAGRARAARARHPPGRPVFIMLPRVPAWYAAMLGAIRIGAVAMPGTEPADGARHRVPDRGARTRSAVDHRRGRRREGRRDRRGPAVAAPPDRLGRAAHATGWHDFDALMDAAGDGATPASTRPRRDDPMILFFTSGTVSYPKMVAAPAVLRARAHRDRALLARPAPGRPALDGHRHGLGEGRLGRPLRPVARARHGRPGRARQARRRHDPARSSRDAGITSFCAPADALPDAGAGRPRRLRPLGAAPLHERGRAAQPRGHPRLAGRAPAG